MLSDILLRLRTLFRRRAVEAELDEELRYHLDREAQKYRRMGSSPEDAMRHARMAIGGPEQVRQQCRDARGTKLFEDFTQDLRYGLRMLRKNPRLTAMIVLSLALGIGANTAIFSVTSTLLLKPLPYPNADRLAILWLRSPGIGIPQDWPSIGQYHDIKTQNKVFDDTAILIGRDYILTGLSRAMKVDGISASSSLLPMLGVKPLLGRIFLPEEDKPGNTRTVVLTYALWQRAFSGDPNIIGRSITIDGIARTVVGVLPRDFRLNHEVVPTVGGIDKPELFLPLPLDSTDEQDYGSENFDILARVKPGVTMQQAQADIGTIAARLREEKHRDPSFTISVVPLLEQVVGNVRSAVLIMFGAVSLVLLIACTNVANLLLSRATVRQKEIAMRTALGAGRMRVVIQLLTESVLLGLLGGAAGLAIAAGCLFAVRQMHPGNIPRLDELGMDFRVLIFTIAISILTGIVFGLAPALRASRSDLNAALKAGGRGARSGGLTVKRDKLRGALVIAELAVSLTLLTGAGLLVRSFVRLVNVPPGFNPDHVISMQVAAYGPKYDQDAQRIQFYQNLAQRVLSLPGVTSQGEISALPLTPSVGWGGMQIEGYVPPPNQPELQVDVRTATPGYFTAMEIPLKQGRLFSSSDTDKSQPVVLVDEKMANRFWPQEDAVGKRIRQNEKSPWLIIAGVVGVVKQYGLDTDTRMVVYYPRSQHRGGEMFVVARTTGEPAALADAIVQQVRAIDPDVPVNDIATMQQRVHESVTRQRFAMTMLGAFAAFAMILAAVGVYGVMSFLVTQGTPDIAIRMALGAQRNSILALVFQQGMALALIGIAAGLLGAFGLTRLMSGLLFGVSSNDPLTFVGVALLLTLVALSACYFPARRAMRVDPMAALREE
ncbi:MAG: ABC transporter permease [Terracidiphilus sp.]|jgi:predicted permease